MTQLFYGGYAHAPNSVYVESWQRQTVLGETGWPELLRINAGFRTKLLGSSMADLMAQATAMQQAYSLGGQNLQFVDNFGNSTAWFLNSNTAVGGVVVTNPVSFGEVKGAEGTLFLYCRFALQADYAVSNGTQYLSFKETVSFSDNNGQPLTVERIPVNGRPIIQQISESSFYYASQSGELWQGSPNPQPMSPLWPGNLRGQPGSRKSGLINPKAVRGQAYKWGVTWSYEFVSTSPLIGYPNVY